MGYKWMAGVNMGEMVLLQHHLKVEVHNFLISKADENEKQQHNFPEFAYKHPLIDTMPL